MHQYLSLKGKSLYLGQIYKDLSLSKYFVDSPEVTCRSCCSLARAVSARVGACCCWWLLRLLVARSSRRSEVLLVAVFSPVEPAAVAGPARRWLLDGRGERATGERRKRGGEERTALSPADFAGGFSLPRRRCRRKGEGRRRRWFERRGRDE
ncbi:hypothetical protein KY284_021851 [Solanum tuberosum]|nr:hypothetical protein KY284_021851 [Solanum tuberosum]